MRTAGFSLISMHMLNSKPTLTDPGITVEILEQLAPKGWDVSRLSPSGMLQRDTWLSGCDDYTGINAQNWRSDYDYLTGLKDYHIRDSIVLFGCSCTWGIGIPEFELTIAHKLSRATGRRVINLSYPGTGLDFALDMARRFRMQYGIPHAVIHLWSHYIRWRGFIHNGWRPSPGLLKKGDTPWDLHTRAWEQWTLWPLLWQGSRMINRSWFRDTSELYSIPWIEYRDHGLDGLHPGPVTVDWVVNDLVEQLALAK